MKNFFVNYEVEVPDEVSADEIRDAFLTNVEWAVAGTVTPVPANRFVYAWELVKEIAMSLLWGV